MLEDHAGALAIGARVADMTDRSWLPGLRGTTGSPIRVVLRNSN
jgi:hypothetical protein